MTYMYTDENREYMASMLPDGWRDTFRNVWNLRTESSDSDKAEATKKLIDLAHREHEVDPENVAELNFSSAMVVLNEEEFGCTKHALACSYILKAATCDNPTERRNLLEVAETYLRISYRTRDWKG